MPVEHVIYIPAAVLLGIVIGYIAGSRAASAEYERRKKRLRD